jgi:hypothetical protein
VDFALVDAGKLAKASNVWPTTIVIKGAIPPEAMEVKIAGSTKVKKWRRGIRENNRRIEGLSG